jgi:hypothetical protein
MFIVGDKVTPVDDITFSDGTSHKIDDILTVDAINVHYFNHQLFSNNYKLLSREVNGEVVSIPILQAGAKVLMSTMDIPEQRRDVTKSYNVSWLLRNLLIRNSANPEALKLMEVLSKLLKVQDNP